MKRLLLLLVLTLLPLAAAQEGYWIALNYGVVFYGNGTALVEAKFHPFSVDGRSLFGSTDVEREMNASIPGMLNYTLLMFADNPRLLRIGLPAYRKVLNETVLCDVANTGVMTEFKGAYVLSVLIYLNTSNYIRVLNGTLFEVKVRDSFTSMDVRSWIDVIEFSFKGAELVDYRWEPPYARGPSVKREGYLLWINLNEREAPDFYVFTLRAPEFVYVGEPAEVRAAISSASCGLGGLSVVVSNTGVESGYAYVRVLAGGVEQARKIYISSGASREVRFPEVDCADAVVELYSGSLLLDRREVSGEAPSTRVETRALLPTAALVAIAATVAAIAAAIIVVILQRRHPPPPRVPEPGAAAQ
ncbi:MAG: hypothetical protein QXI84_09170 [Thermofilaceae archaeon]